MYLMLTGYQEYGNKDTANDIHVSLNMNNVAYIVDHGAEGCKLKFIDGDRKGTILVRESFDAINAVLPRSTYRKLTSYYKTNDKWPAGVGGDTGCNVVVTVNMDNVTWITDQGTDGCKLKFVAGNKWSEISVRQSFININSVIDPVAIYVQKEQPK